jgi:hypothetical protein
MRSGIARILADRRAHRGTSFYKIYKIFHDYDDPAPAYLRLIFLDFPIFLDLIGAAGRIGSELTLRILRDFSK